MVIIWWCDLHLHISYSTEIQEAVVVVIIWWCDLQLHMSYITEIQEAVVVVIISWCDLQLHMMKYNYHMVVCTYILLKYKGPSWS